MKKAIVILLTLCLCVSLCACGNTKDIEPTEPTSIELTSENISQYLNIKVNEPTDESYYRWITFEIYPLQAGNFKNVEIELSLNVLHAYILNDATGAELKFTDEYPRNGTVKFLLPADGRYEFDLKVKCLYGSDHPISKWEFNEIKGTFTPTN